MPGVYNRKDRLYEEAKSEGYRSRAAFKLQELSRRYNLLKPGQRVVDLGCFPGGWLQVAAEQVGSSGIVVGIDLVPLEPFTPAEKRLPVVPVVICGDIESEDNLQKIIAATGRPVDVLLSDMSPKLSGVRFRDVAQCAELVERAVEVGKLILSPGGNFVAKFFPGNEDKDLEKKIGSLFRKVHRVRLETTRKTSTEFYFVGLNYIKV